MHPVFYDLGCIVKAYDPSHLVTRPEDSYHPNLHFYNVGIASYDHKYHFTQWGTKPGATEYRIESFR